MDPFGEGRRRGDAMVREVERFSFLAGGRIVADNRLDMGGVKLSLVIEGASFNLDRPMVRGNTLNQERVFSWDEIPPASEYKGGDLTSWVTAMIRDLWRRMWDHEFEELLMHRAADGADLTYVFEPHAHEGLRDQRSDPSVVAANRAQGRRTAPILGQDQVPPGEHETPRRDR